MACCLMATSHYLNQCWLIIKGVLWHSPDNDFTGQDQDTNTWNESQNYIFFKFHQNLLGTSELSALLWRQSLINSSSAVSKSKPSPNKIQIQCSAVNHRISDTLYMRDTKVSFWAIKVVMATVLYLVGEAALPLTNQRREADSLCISGL